MSTWECLSPVDKNQFPICWKHSFVSWTRSMTTDDGESRGKLRGKKSMKKAHFARDWLKINVGDGSGACVKWAWPMFNVTRVSASHHGSPPLRFYPRHRATAGARGTVSVRQLWVTGLLQINIHSEGEENDHRCLVEGTFASKEF